MTSTVNFDSTKEKFDSFQFYIKGRKYFSMLLASDLYNNQAWGALYKARIGYVISCNKLEFDKKIYYRRVIGKLEKELR